MEKVSFYKFVITYIQNEIQRMDVKANILIAIQIAIFGGLSSFIKKIEEDFRSSIYNLQWNISKKRNFYRYSTRLIFLKIVSVLLIFVIGILIAGCAGTSHNNTVVLTDSSQLDAYVGMTITIRGQVANTKTPEILGVDVKSDAPDLRGKMAEATGVLERWTDTQESIANKDAIAGPIQSRAPATYYRLLDPKTKTEAQVRAVKR